ncbi:FAD binding domain-containing protein [Hypoxylon cercidicola]|nr:FAD binding domain-containing protein [Hypoxylon cercidicola]
MPQSVVIVGGSLAGLMIGLQLKRLGRKVTVLEQDPSSERSSYEAGIGSRTNVEAFLESYDVTGIQAALSSHSSQFGLRTYTKTLITGSNLKVSSWGHLYRILRANFDGLASTSCPEPPPPQGEDGDARYVPGKRVTDLQYSDNIVTIHYTDVTSGKEDHIDADMIIGADGSHSTVRKLVGAPTVKEYAGYVAWRGTVPERLVSKETADYFSDSVSVDLLRRSYLICYVIPTDHGSFEPGERLLNFVWYYNVAESSDEMTQIFTDINGTQHHNTVPRGLVKPEEWKRVRGAFKSRMNAPFAELLSLTESPVVTKINDALCLQPTFFEGHGIIVGDALATLRPHTGSASEQAAFHCISLTPVWEGSKTLETWSREACIYGKRMWLLGKLAGEFGQGTAFSLLKSLVLYVVFLVRIKIGRPNV